MTKEEKIQVLEELKKEIEGQGAFNGNFYDNPSDSEIDREFVMFIENKIDRVREEEEALILGMSIPGMLLKINDLLVTNDVRQAKLKEDIIEIKFALARIESKIEE